MLATQRASTTRYSGNWQFIVAASVAAFATYFCMYAFRKPFTAATFEGLQLWGVDYKIILVVSQVAGYALSKFIGIRYVSELSPNNRPLSILLLIGVSWLALLAFAVVPFPFNFICLFFNGLPLGLIWGIVFSFLEGRRTTELLGAVMAVSFIVASGAVKSVGKWLMLDFGVSPFWMPFATGAIFVLPLMISVRLLATLPPPSVSDVYNRSERRPMTAADRRGLFNRYWVGIVLLVAFYLILSALRDFRDNFIVEIWAELGYTNASILTSAEMPIAVSVLLLVASTVLIRDNATAFWLNHLAIAFGCAVLLIATFLFENNLLSPISWMVLCGFGLYLAYILFQSLIFERMMATFREAGNVGFLMYVADAFGYLGSVSVLLYKNFFQHSGSWRSFFHVGTLAVGFFGIFLVMGSLFYFFRKYDRLDEDDI
jgi:hypothetical protein